MQLTKHFFLVALCAVLIAACSDRKPVAGVKTTVDGVADEPLPAPSGTPGSAVTGMPGEPGPGTPAATVEEPLAEEIALDADGNPLPPVDEGDELGLEPPEQIAFDEGAAPVAVPADEPNPQEAVAVVRDYYAAINGGAFARAYALWSDGGRASGQSPQQFADGFANTMGVSVQIGAPGPVQGAPGSRFIEVPVSLIAGQREGGERHFEGTYILRRTAVDSAAGQRVWRISSATLNEVQ